MDKVNDKTTMDNLKISRQQTLLLLNEKNKIYKCEICDKEFKINNTLKKHFNIVHNFVKEHQCNICQKDFNFQSQLTKHVKNAHENKKQQHQCNSCGKSFSQGGHLKIHINSVHNGQ